RAVQEELFEGAISVHYDDRTQFTPGWKFNEWEMKGVPLRIEIGPREVRDNRVVAVRRDTGLKISLEATNLVRDVRNILDSVQKTLFSRAKMFLEEHTVRVDDYSSLKRVLDERGGFIKACWCSSQECEDKIKVETGATIRVIPFNQEPVWSGCIYCGKTADKVVYFARAY
ncbi:proline--tRNA ligase, partial [Candidatus Bathyarchaeota archaeon]|nr:proline--tRNA ligase [Candidatus Bathyarchaeota archaeon]